MSGTSGIAQDFYSYSTNTGMCVGRAMQELLPRRNGGSIAGYVTGVATPKMDKKTCPARQSCWASKTGRLFFASSLIQYSYVACYVPICMPRGTPLRCSCITLPTHIHVLVEYE